MYPELIDSKNSNSLANPIIESMNTLDPTTIENVDITRPEPGTNNSVLEPNPSPIDVTTAQTQSVQQAQKVGPATTQVVQNATANASPNNPLPIAAQYLGINELDPEGVELRTKLWDNIHGIDSDKSNQAIDSNFAWCGAFVEYVLDSMGSLETLDTGAGWASNWQKVGTEVSGKTINERLNNAKAGDIVLVKTKTGSKRHVAFYAGHDPATGKVKLLGGNQGDKVSIIPWSSSGISNIRRIRMDEISKEEQERISKLMITTSDKTL